MNPGPQQPDGSAGTDEAVPTAEMERATRRNEIRQAAVGRDVSAERRDRTANDRDAASQERRAALADSDDVAAWRAHDQLELADRSASSLDRIHSGRDRDAAASDLANLSELARLDRLAAAEQQVLSDAEQAVIVAAIELRDGEEPPGTRDTERDDDQA